MDTEDVPVSAVGVKIPPFWEEDPEAWFGQAEAQYCVYCSLVLEQSTLLYKLIVYYMKYRLQYSTVACLVHLTVVLQYPYMLGYLVI